jgi:hypothetical protein
MSVIRGSIVDDSGAGVPDQPVTLKGWNSDRRTRPRRTEDGPDESDWNPADIYVGERRARTDDLGRFSFADLSAGTYRVVTQRRGADREIEQSVPVPAGARVDGIRLVLPDSGRILEGRVVDEQGNPIKKAYVRAVPESGSTADRVSADTQRDGRFVLRGLMSGSYQVRAEASYWSFEPGSERTLAPTEILGLEPGRRDLDIVLRRGAVLHGLVLFEDGRPVERIAVVGTIVGSDVRVYGVTQSSGRFQMTVAEDDLVDLEVQPTWPGATAVRAPRVAPGEQEVLLRLPDRR